MRVKSIVALMTVGMLVGMAACASKNTTGGQMQVQQVQQVPDAHQAVVAAHRIPVQRVAVLVVVALPLLHEDPLLDAPAVPSTEVAAHVHLLGENGRSEIHAHVPQRLTLLPSPLTSSQLSWQTATWISRCFLSFSPQR